MSNEIEKYKVETKDGIILPDSEFGRRIGFTSDKFYGYLWKRGDSIYISMIVSKKPMQGNFSRFIDNILRLGYKVKVPTPIGIMPLILAKKGFKKTHEYDEKFGGMVEVWVKEP